MTDTPRVTERSFNLWLQEAQEKASSPGVFLSWRDDLVLDYADSRALAQSQAATIAERNAEIEQLKGRKPFKLEVSKEWCLRMAESEGDAVIGAGVPGPEHKASSMLAEALAEIDRLHSIYIQACNGRAEIREALMAERSANAALTERLARAEAAQEYFKSRDLIVMLYEHGGARVYRLDKNGNRDLIMDLYEPAERRDAILVALTPTKEP